MQSQSHLSRAVWSEHHQPVVVWYSTVWVERADQGPGLQVPHGASGLQDWLLVTLNSVQTSPCGLAGACAVRSDYITTVEANS